MLQRSHPQALLLYLRNGLKYSLFLSRPLHANDCNPDSTVDVRFFGLGTLTIRIVLRLLKLAEDHSRTETPMLPPDAQLNCGTWWSGHSHRQDGLYSMESFRKWGQSVPIFGHPAVEIV